MRLVACALATGVLAAPAAAAAAPGFEFPDIALLDKRQMSGAKFECHRSCGGTIAGSRRDGFCEDVNWRQSLSDCFDCAFEQDIWRDYGNSVGAAANRCGIDTPQEPGSGPSSSAPETETAAESSSSVAVSSTIASSSATATLSTAISTMSSSVVPTASDTGTSSRPTSPSASTTAVTMSGGAQTACSGVVVAGAAALFFTALLF